MSERTDQRAAQRSHRAVRGGALLSRPWTRAPLLLLRRPSVFLAIVGAVAVLTVAAASGLLFLSTLNTASLQAQAADDCPEYSLPAATTNVRGDQVQQATRTGAQAFTATGLPAPYSVQVGSTHVQDSLVHLVSLPGALQHVHKLTPEPATAGGAWIPDVFAKQVGTHAGGTITTRSGAPIRVAGIYQDLAPSPFTISHLPRFFCTWKNQIVATAAADAAIAQTPVNLRQGAFLISDEQTVARASDGEVTLSWYAPLPHDTTPLSGYERGQRQARQAAAAVETKLAVPVTVDDRLQKKIDIANHAQDGVSGSVIPIDLAGVVVAGLLVGGAGVFWATHRSREIRLLVARGIGPGPLGTKAVLETAPAALVGLGAGFAGAYFLVRQLAPAPMFSPGAPLRAFLAGLGAVVAGLLVIGVIGALSGRDKVIGARRGRLRFVPWELGLLAIAVWLGLLIRSGSGVTVKGPVVHVDPLLFLFPILGSVAVLLLLGRLIAAVLPALGRRAGSSGRLGRAGYFALRRIAGSRLVAVGLVVGTALPCCLLTYGSTVTTGVSDEITAKYRTNLGAENVLMVIGLNNRSIDTHGQGSLVSAYQSEPRLPGGTESYLLAIDPQTFAQFALMTGEQRADAAKLHPVPNDRPVPAILVNAPAGTDAGSVTIRNSTLPLEVVATSSVFPGLRNGFRPMVVIDRSAIPRIDPGADIANQLWTSDAHLGSALALLQNDGLTMLGKLTTDVAIGSTGLLPVTWIFDYLRALAILIGVVAIAGLVFALAARTRRRTVSYVMSRRMGLGKAAHLRSLLIELALVVGFGWLAGSGVGAGAFGFIYRSLDVYPDLPPPASFGVPTATLIGTLLTTAVVVAVAAASTHLLAERARPADILRLE
jgi:putative ABC transport system permease protein